MCPEFCAIPPDRQTQCIARLLKPLETLLQRFGPTFPRFDPLDHPLDYAESTSGADNNQAETSGECK